MSNLAALHNAPREVLEEIAREYEQTLVIPDTKSSPQWMLLSVGLIGSGKTTTVKPLAEHFGLMRICTDDIRERLKLHGYSFEGARDVAYELTKKYLELGYSLAIDANAGGKTGLEYNRKVKEAFPQIRQIFIHINTPEELIIKQIRNRKNSLIFRDAEEAIERFHFHKQNFTLPDLPYVYTFDPSRDDFPEQLAQCIGAIERRLQAA